MGISLLLFCFYRLCKTLLSQQAFYSISDLVALSRYKSLWLIELVGSSPFFLFFWQYFDKTYSPMNCLLVWAHSQSRKVKTHICFPDHTMLSKLPSTQGLTGLQKDAVWRVPRNNHLHAAHLALHTVPTKYVCLAKWPALHNWATVFLGRGCWHWGGGREKEGKQKTEGQADGWEREKIAEKGEWQWGFSGKRKRKSGGGDEWDASRKTLWVPTCVCACIYV